MTTLRVGDVDLAYADHGTGDPPLVLVHGFTSSQNDWDGVVDDLAAERRVLTYDHRGHGASTNTGDASTYSFAQLVIDLTGLLDALGIETAHLLGHSMGGSVVMRFALAYPERVASLILMDTGAEGDPKGMAAQMLEGSVAIAREQGMAGLGKLVRGMASNPMTDVQRRVREGPDGEALLDALEAKWSQMDVEAFASLGRELGHQTSVMEDLRAISAPTTVMVGEGDIPDLRTQADAMAERIPGAVLEVIPGAEHNPQIENREAWLGVLERHFARL